MTVEGLNPRTTGHECYKFRRNLNGLYISATVEMKKKNTFERCKSFTL